MKFDFKPTSSACLRKILTHREWKVPNQGIPSTISPNIEPTRNFISRAALFVNVTARISLGRARFIFIKWTIRVVKALVFPVPAPANIRTGPSITSTAARCDAFSPSIYGVARTPIARCDNGTLEAISMA